MKLFNRGLGSGLRFVYEVGEVTCLVSIDRLCPTHIQQSEFGGRILLRLPPKSDVITLLIRFRTLISLVESAWALRDKKKSAINVLCCAVLLTETRPVVERATFPLEVTNVSTGEILTLCCDGRPDLANLRQ